jgi:multiple sugar transport system substrate-binding protein
VIALILVVTVVITAASALLVANMDRSSGPGLVFWTAALGVLTVLSGILISSLPKIVMVIWRQSEEANIGFIDLVDRLGRTLRRPLKLIGVGLVAVLVVAVGVVLRPPPTELEPGRLVIMTAFGDSPNDPRSVLIDQWNQLHPRNPVEIDYAPGETDQQNERMVNDAKPGGVHKADVYVLDLVWMAQFVDRGYILRLDESKFSGEGVDDFIPKVLATCKRNEGLWALPFNSDAGLIFYRDIPGVGKPEKWSDYFGESARGAVMHAKSSDPRIEAANAAQLADEEVLTITALEAVWAAGGEVVGSNGQVLLKPDDSEVDFNQAALNGIKNLADASQDPDIVVTGEAKDATEKEAVTAFTNGRTLYMRNWPVARDEVSRIVGNNIEFEVAATPTASVLGGQNLAISSSTDKPRAAQALIEFLTNPSSQLTLSEIGGFVPTRHSAFANAKRPYSQEVRSALDAARLRPITPNYTEFSRAFRKGIGRALNNNGKLEPEFTKELAEIWKRK